MTCLGCTYARISVSYDGSDTELTDIYIVAVAEIVVVVVVVAM